MTMSASPIVLATYLAAAARQVIEGEELSARSHWAIAHAKKQLKGNHDVIAEEEAFLASTYNAGVQGLKPEEEPDLAEIVLSVTREDETRPQFAARKEQATAELRKVLGDLEAVDRGGSSAPAKESAKHLLEIFGPPSSSIAA
jgi:hypothetical protein